MEGANLSPPVAYSGNLSGGVDSFLVAAESSSQAGSAAGSFQNEGFLSGGGGSDAGFGNGPDPAEFGFQRAGFGQEPLTGTVQPYDRHVFLCYKTPQIWPSHIEAAEFDRLPRLLSAALKARKAEMNRRTRLTICEGEDGTESSNGDILIFPDMTRYRRLTHFDVDNFVEEALVKDAEWLPGSAETLTGSHVFVCAHGSRDRRCGVCGPAIIKRFKEEIKSRGLQGQVSVSPCSHIGGHKYAGNVIIFSPNVTGEVTGHWYGYVSPDDVPALLDKHIGEGEILAHLWRGQMGLSEDEQIMARNGLLSLNGEIKNGKPAKENAKSETDLVNGVHAPTGCCQGGSNLLCCQNNAPGGETRYEHKEECDTQKISNHSDKQNEESNSINSNKGSAKRTVCVMPTWYECWEREDTYAALAVAAAVVSVTIAYGCYKRLK